MYIAVSDMLLTYVKSCWAIVYDHVYAENYGITGVYDLVKNGEWTLDRLIDFTGTIYEDKNGDGKKDDGDFYGLTYRAEGCSFAASLYGLGVRSAQIEDNQLVMTLYSEHTVDVFDKLFGMLESQSTLKAPYDGKYTEKLFPHGCAVFANLSLGHCYNNLREYENPYGIIPLPKCDEQQERYCTTLLASADVQAPGTAVIGTVRGDLHDIGKNLVKMMLEGKRITVIDLGTDVSAEKFVAAAMENNAQIICCSALLTTTMSEMEAVVKEAEAKGIREKVFIMVGGAPITQEFCDKIGADCYTSDAASASEAALAYLKQ